MVNFINDIIMFPFLQKALITAIVVGLITGVIGSFIILRGESLMGDAISHAILPGVAISYMLSISYFYGALVMGIITSFTIGFVSNNSKIKSDSAIGIIFSAFFALGILLLTKAQTAIDLTSILFGNVLTVQSKDMYLTIFIGIVVIASVIIFFRQFLITSFDPIMAKSIGINTKFYHYFMMLLLTLVTIASLMSVGSILVVALLITPASTAYLLTNKIKVMIALSSLFGVISSIIGLYFSFSFNLSSGASIVLVSFVLFLIAFLFAPKNGLVFNLKGE